MHASHVMCILHKHFMQCTLHTIQSLPALYVVCSACDALTFHHVLRVFGWKSSLKWRHYLCSLKITIHLLYSICLAFIDIMVHTVQIQDGARLMLIVKPIPNLTPTVPTHPIFFLCPNCFDQYCQRHFNFPTMGGRTPHI